MPPTSPTPATTASATAVAVTPAYKWWVVGMLWFICFFNYADRQSISAVFPKLQQEFGFTKEQLGLIGSAFMWVYAGGAPVAGLICDRFRRKDLILGGCIFWSVVTMATGWCSRLWHFVTVRALEGFGETFYFPASMSLTSDYHDRRTRSRALALHQSSVYVGTILGSWFGALIAERYGWRYGFYFFGGAGLTLALVLYRVLREPARGEADAAVRSEALAAHGLAGGGRLTIPETLAIVFRTPAVPFLMLGFLGANFVATIFLTWTPTFLVEKFHYKLAGAGLSGTLYIHLASACSVPLAGWLADRFAQRLAGGRVLVQAAGLLVGAGFVATVGHTENKATLIIAMTLFGFCKGFYDSGIFASLYDAIEPRARGTAAGIMNTVGWGGGALGPLYVGWAATRWKATSEVAAMSEAITWCGAVYLVAAGLLLTAVYWLRHPRPGITATLQPLS